MEAEQAEPITVSLLWNDTSPPVGCSATLTLSVIDHLWSTWRFVTEKGVVRELWLHNGPVAAQVLAHRLPAAAVAALYEVETDFSDDRLVTPIRLAIAAERLAGVMPAQFFDVHGQPTDLATTMRRLVERAVLH